jgi:CRISPR type I-E-associated protein CasA/Cse1
MIVAPELSFNAWTSAWLPLHTATGTVWASPVEVLCGEKDAPDLDYPRDDFRVYARLLLSALVQACFPAKNKAELAERLDSPLRRADVEKRLAEVLNDFDLFGSAPFLQIAPLEKIPEKGAAPFVFPGEDLFRSPSPIHAVSLPIALLVLFIEQTYAGGAGRGYGAGPGGQPGTFTLIDPGSIRQGAWANSLTTDEVAKNYTADGDKPWSNFRRKAQPRASLGIVTGLFFQPRGAWLIPSGTGRCSFTGVEGLLVFRSPLIPKSELAKKAAGTEDLWQHPCAPLALNSQGIGAVRLNTEKPAWTGLAQLLAPRSARKGKGHPREGAALVLRQWKTLNVRSRRPRLIVLDFDRDKANVRRRFFESFPLSAHLTSAEVIEHLRLVLDEAQYVASALERALLEAHDKRKSKKAAGLALPDARAAFWAATEGPFFSWLDIIVRSADVDTADAEADVLRARSAMQLTMSQRAVSIFDAHVQMSEFDLRKQEQVAKARRMLRATLSKKIVGTQALALP